MNSRLQCFITSKSIITDILDHIKHLEKYLSILVKNKEIFSLKKNKKTTTTLEGFLDIIKNVQQSKIPQNNSQTNM